MIRNTRRVTAPHLSPSMCELSRNFLTDHPEPHYAYACAAEQTRGDLRKQTSSPAATPGPVIHHAETTKAPDNHAHGRLDNRISPRTWEPTDGNASTSHQAQINMVCPACGRDEQPQ